MKPKSESDNKAGAVAPAATCSAIFATSLRRMAEWYGYHPTPGAITPLDAIQAALCDVAIASEKAAEGLVWKSQNEWEPFRQNDERIRVANNNPKS